MPLDNPRLKIVEKLIQDCGVVSIPELIPCLTDETQKTSSGFPSISEAAFQHFRDHINHLFANGAHLIEWLTTIGNHLAVVEIDENDRIHLERSIRVIRNVIYTAAVTCPSDLWIMRHLLSVYRRLGITLDLKKGRIIGSEKYCEERSIDRDHFRIEMALLRSRGFLEKSGEGVRLIPTPQNIEIVEKTIPIPDEFPVDMVPPTTRVLQNNCTAMDAALCDKFYRLDVKQTDLPGWTPTFFDLEAAFRLVPFVLACRVLGLNKSMAAGAKISASIPNITETMKDFLKKSGMVQADGCLSLLGFRVFSRGPGPFGIIHAYHSYMTHLDLLIIGQKSESWVARGENVAASQDANAKTFKMANEAIDRFCTDTGFRYDVFIEHAVGQGEATRQRFELSGDASIQYFGADLEDAAIKKAKEAQAEGLLPPKMQFISNADIGQPQVLIDGIDSQGSSTNGAVMVVGNGFHEVRGQTDEKMVEIFRNYCTAGILIVFTEESGLSDEDLLETGWNTYHAGFRFVHELSGQGLRPAIDQDSGGRYSWVKCATEANYVVLDQYTTRTRTIFPHPKPDGRNPAISVNYFCVPKAIWNQLNK